MDKSECNLQLVFGTYLVTEAKRRGKNEKSMMGP